MDWARLVIADGFRDDAVRLLKDWANCEAIECKGLFFREAGWEVGGAKVLYDVKGNEHGSIVELPGAWLQAIGPDGVWFVLTSLQGMGGRFTRLDIAVDLVGARALGLCAMVYASYLRGELCGAKSVKEVKSHAVWGVDGHTVYIGKRGNEGSGRFIRVYDKGLETGLAGSGVWVRWELEMSGDVAALVGATLVQERFPGTTSAERARAREGRMREYVFGAVDFREWNGSAELARRPRCQWYADLAECEGRRVVAPQVRARLRSWGKWLCTAVLPTAMAMTMMMGGKANVEDLAAILGWDGDVAFKRCSQQLGTDFGAFLADAGADGGRWRRVLERTDWGADGVGGTGGFAFAREADRLARLEAAAWAAGYDAMGSDVGGGVSGGGGVALGELG